MGIFSKSKDKQKEKNYSSQKIPELPSLPSLPQYNSSPNFPLMDDYEEKKEIHQLPSFPSSPTGDMFSKNTIKSAVKGEPALKYNYEDDDEDLEIEPPRYHKEISNNQFEKKVMKENYEIKPVFVRIDKFQEGLKLFEETKENLGEIDKLLKEVKHLKEKESEELSSWEKDLEKIKNQIEKINQEIFSKI